MHFERQILTLKEFKAARLLKFLIWCFVAAMGRLVTRTASQATMCFQAWTSFAIRRRELAALALNHYQRNR